MTEQKHQTNLYVIGNNGDCQLAIPKKLNDQHGVSKLIHWNSYNKDIIVKTVICGETILLYCTDNGYWVTGNNRQGQCCINKEDVANICEIPHEIEYFKLNNINIHLVCSNVAGDRTFWISDKQIVYGNGNNDDYQIGPKKKNDYESAADIDHHDIPKLITDLKNKHVIDIKSCNSCSIALCQFPVDNLRKIIRNWFRNNKVDLAHDIMLSIQKFVPINEVYSTLGHAIMYGENGHGEEIDLDAICNIDLDAICDNDNQQSQQKHGTWKRIEFLNKNAISITKIDCGYAHTVLLDSIGQVWCCGSNRAGQLGLGDLEVSSRPTPTRVKYFQKNNIQIKDIACGYYHTLAVDINGHLYAWGHNLYLQCSAKLMVQDFPRLVLKFKEYEVIAIKCGRYHSYVRTRCGKHFLFGLNEYNICSLKASRENKQRPIDITNIIKQKIIDVCLGKDNTIIITE